MFIYIYDLDFIDYKITYINYNTIMKIDIYGI